MVRIHRRFIRASYNASWPGHRGEDYWRYKEDRNEPKKAMGSGCGTGTTRRRRRCPGRRGWICRGQWGRERLRGEVLRGHAARYVSACRGWGGNNGEGPGAVRRGGV